MIKDISFAFSKKKISFTPNVKTLHSWPLKTKNQITVLKHTNLLLRLKTSWSQILSKAKVFEDFRKILSVWKTMLRIPSQIAKVPFLESAKTIISHFANPIFVPNRVLFCKHYLSKMPIIQKLPLKVFTEKARPNVL